jgi:hypothetical protein
VVRAVPAGPTPLKSPDIVSEALNALSLAPRKQREGPKSAPPSEANEIRRHITIHMGPNPSYDNRSVFYASYTELSASYGMKTSSYYDDSNSGFGTFPPRLCHTPVVITALVARGHLPALEDMEFMRMGSGRGDHLRHDMHGLGLEPESLRKRQ